MFGDLEEDATVAFFLDPSFPTGDVQQIAQRLAGSGCLIPGFIPPERGLIDLTALLYAELIERNATVVIPDRNIASRMSKIPREGAKRPFDTTTQIAVDLMALSQAMNLDLEPAVAFHELGHREGNEVANRELRWFRAADFGQANAWIDVALGRQDSLPVAGPGPPTSHNFAAPLHRWRCNYVVALKVAMIELGGGPDIQKLQNLMTWMVDEFIVAGPAAIYAAMYFGPRAQRSGLIKQLRAVDRERAIKGVKNAAWDITYLSEFSRRAQADPYDERRWIFATGDRKLSDIARCLFIDAEDEASLGSILAGLMSPWWHADAERAASVVASAMAAAQSRSAPFQAEPDTGYVDRPLAALERLLRTPI